MRAVQPSKEAVKGEKFIVPVGWNVAVPEILVVVPARGLPAARTSHHGRSRGRGLLVAAPSATRSTPRLDCSSGGGEGDGEGRCSLVDWALARSDPSPRRAGGRRRRRRRRDDGRGRVERRRCGVRGRVGGLDMGRASGCGAVSAPGEPTTRR